MWVHFFSKIISVYAIFNDQSFNDTLTNNIVSFVQLGPVVFLFKKAPYLELCSTFNTKTTPLTSPLLGSPKVVLIAVVYGIWKRTVFMRHCIYCIYSDRKSWWTSVDPDQTADGSKLFATPLADFRQTCKLPDGFFFSNLKTNMELRVQVFRVKYDTSLYSLLYSPVHMLEFLDYLSRHVFASLSRPLQEDKLAEETTFSVQHWPSLS